MAAPGTAPPGGCPHGRQRRVNLSPPDLLAQIELIDRLSATGVQRIEAGGPGTPRNADEHNRAIDRTSST